MSNSCMALLIVVVGAAFAERALAGSDTQATRAVQLFRDCSNCPEMVGVPAGSFLMGSSTAEIKRGLELLPPDESEADKLTFATEQPQHSVTIARSFGMSSYLVTRDEYAAFVRETDYSSSGDCTLFVNHRYEQRADAGWRSPGFAQSDRDPAVCVSWHDALAYITWLNSRLRGRTSVVDDGPYRLPSEAEWEYAARAGTKTVRWWGDSIGSDNANCEGCGSRWDDKQPAPVGSFHPNPFGLFDMLGNVWEWTQDCWNKSYEGAPVDGSAWTVGKWCQYRAIRGGSFASRPWLLRPAKRTFLDSDRSANYVGFRVVKALQ